MLLTYCAILAHLLLKSCSLTAHLLLTELHLDHKAIFNMSLGRKFTKSYTGFCGHKGNQSN